MGRGIPMWRGREPDFLWEDLSAVESWRRDVVLVHWRLPRGLVKGIERMRKKLGMHTQTEVIIRLMLEGMEAHGIWDDAAVDGEARE